MRTASTLFSRRPFKIRTSVPIISFTFDDFPRSALHTGGAILEEFGLKGTYYTSFGLMGKVQPTGKMFLPEDVRTAAVQGHELGCHTFGHCHAWETRPDAFEESVLENRRALATFLLDGSFRSLSFPLSPPRVGTKKRVADHFLCCRGGGQTYNVDEADSNCLYGYFLEKSRHNPVAVENVIDENARVRGWLIFATHDVSESPTPYGCTPEFFRRIVGHSVNSGARILPVAAAWQALQVQSKAS
jgi:peptidoglycan/xylan/chitin deacetylase (PgdA/CDA1 family)